MKKSTHTLLKWAGILLVSFQCSVVFGQSKQEDTSSVYSSLNPLDKQTRLKNIDIIMNQFFNLRNDFENGVYTGSKFKFEQFRLEIKGYVHEKVYFRFRHRYTSDFKPASVDKIIKGVDFAYLRFDLTKRTQLTIGKTFADWGGIEFDLNPVLIYEYSDIIEQADNFLTGVGLYHQVTPNHGLSFQVLNSRTGTFVELYDSIPTMTAAKTPMAGVVNWRGRLFNGKVNTLWSYSYFLEAQRISNGQNIGKHYIALGNKFTSKKFDVSYDFKWSNEDLDRTGIISNTIPDNLYNYAVENCLYYSHWTRLEYRFTEGWQLCFDGFIDFADWLNDLDPMKTENRIRTSYGFIPTIEYFPWEDLNFKFFFGYVGRVYDYSDYATSRFGAQDGNTGRIILGFMSPLQVL
ncbi:MAG: OprO/OprP family phosphate-selective porin [Schleiferiaceae bacterium]|jgi:hypothetical protein|nr:OprO/OprP family phosphate-selective porin [Schleiferiaceae bacterium]